MLFKRLLSNQSKVIDSIIQDVKEESSITQTISIHQVEFLIKASPTKFKRVIDRVLWVLRNTTAYFDDIMIPWKT